MPDRNCHLLCLLWVIGVGVLMGLCGSVRAEELRDPFTFGPRTGEQGASPILMGILWDATHPLAMVGEREVTVGESVAGWQVVEIQPDGMTIRRGDQQEIVRPGEVFPP